MDRRRFLAAAAFSAAAAAADPRAFAARLGGIVPLALVTADLESRVVALDLSSGRIVSTVETAPDPRSIEAVDAGTALVGHTGPGVVSILVSAGGVGLRGELDRFDEPRYAAVHPRRGLAYVTDSASEELVVVDAVRVRIVWRTRLPGPARHVSISPDGRTVWTVLGNAAERVAVLDTSDARRPKLIRTIAPPFLAHDIVFAPDGKSVWVTSGEERRIAIYGPERRPRRTLAAGAPPQHVAFAREKAFVASGDDGTLRRHRLDGTLVREARVPAGSYNVCVGWDRVLSPSLAAGTLSVLDRNGRVLAVLRVARAAHDACVVIAR